MKRIIVVLFCLVALLVVGCSSPVRYIYQQPYSGVLVSADLHQDGNYKVAAGSITLGDKVIFGKFYNSKGDYLRDLEIGATYRLSIMDDSQYYIQYYVEKIKD